MAENSRIEWTDHTFNPWIGCTKVSPACHNCYAERDFDHRFGKAKWGPSGTRVVTSEANWDKPRAWNADAEKDGVRRRVFCASLADVFEDWRGQMLDSNSEPLMFDKTPRSTIYPKRPRPATMVDLRAALFQLIDETPWLDWLLLTKRPENIMDMFPKTELFRQHVWLGTSIENQEWADRRLHYLHDAKRYGMCGRTFVSAEPLVGPVVLQGRRTEKAYNHLGDGGIDWVITGGESGPDARPCDPEWFRSLRDQCELSGTPFHFKQWGEFDEHQNRVGKKKAGRMLDGITHDGVPIGA